MSKITEIIDREVAEFLKEFELVTVGAGVAGRTENFVNFLRLSYSRLLQGLVGEIKNITENQLIASEDEVRCILALLTPLSQNEG